MVRFNKKLGLKVLSLVAGLSSNYGKARLVNILLANIDEINVQQTKKILFQLLEKGYLIEKNVGSSFPIKVIFLTEKGKSALSNGEEIILDFEEIYSDDFRPAKDVFVVDKNILEEYYFVKKELAELQKKEEELKETIKKAMIEKKASEIESEHMFVFCKKISRINYPKDKIEKYVPESILDKVRTKNETIVLSTKFK